MIFFRKASSNKPQMLTRKLYYRKDDRAMSAI